MAAWCWTSGSRSDHIGEGGERLGRINELAAKVVGDRLVGDQATADIEPLEEVGIVEQCLPCAAVGQCQCVGQRHVVKRVGRSARHRARHVGDAVVDDAVDRRLPRRNRREAPTPGRLSSD